jgi:hypothetical protein
MRRLPLRLAARFAGLLFALMMLASVGLVLTLAFTGSL